MASVASLVQKTWHSRSLPLQHPWYYIPVMGMRPLDNRAVKAAISLCFRSEPSLSCTSCKDPSICHQRRQIALVVASLELYFEYVGLGAMKSSGGHGKRERDEQGGRSHIGIFDVERTFPHVSPR